MPIGAAIGAAAVGGGATLLSSSNASNAAQQQGQLTYQASQDALAEQQRQFNTIQDNNAPYRQIGTSAIGALGSSFGLPGYGVAPSMTTVGAGSTVGQPANSSGTVPAVSMTGGTPATSAPSVSPGATGGQPDYSQVLTDRPDVAAEYSRLAATADPNSPWFSQHGLDGGAQGFAQWWATQGGGAQSGYQVPLTPATATQVAQTPAATTTASGAPAGYTDPTAPNGYSAGARPMTAPIPGQYQAPSLNVSLGAYQQSPDYNFRLQQGNNALDHVASSMGGVMSGARLKAADRYNQDYATTDYNNWRDYTTGQYNTSNAFGNTQAQQAITQADQQQATSNGLYQDDRNYDTSRYDTRTGQLMSLAGFGQSANNANANAAQSFATNSGNLLMTGAQAQGNAAINSANAYTSGVNNLLTAGSYLGGKLMTGGSSAGAGGYDAAIPYSWAGT